MQTLSQQWSKPQKWRMYLADRRQKHYCWKTLVKWSPQPADSSHCKNGLSYLDFSPCSFSHAWPGGALRQVSSHKVQMKRVSLERPQCFSPLAVSPHRLRASVETADFLSRVEPEAHSGRQSVCFLLWRCMTVFCLSRLDDALMCLVGDWWLSLLFIKELCLNLFILFFF